MFRPASPLALVLGAALLAACETPNTTTPPPPNLSMTIAVNAPNNADEDGSGDISAGDTLTYQVVATNNGDAALSGVTVSSNLVSPNAAATSSLTPGQAWTLVGIYVVTAADVTSGAVSHTGSATASELALPVSLTVSLPTAPPPIVAAGGCTSDGSYTSSGFTCLTPGALLGGSSAAAGNPDATNLYPGLRFPLAQGPAYLNSQVYRYKNGGAPAHQPGWLAADGSDQQTTTTSPKQCDARNYQFPWQDTFCESRGNGDPGNDACPAGAANPGHGHQGVDIRGSVCQTDAAANEVVAVADGEILAIFPHYTKQIDTSGAVHFNYMHMHRPSRTFTESHINGGVPMASNTTVDLGDGILVTRGQRLGNIGNIQKDMPGPDLNADKYTTRHLHFEMRTAVWVDGELYSVVLPPYATLVDAYERLEAGNP